MVSTESTIECNKYKVHKLLLKRYEPDPLLLGDNSYKTEPRTPSEWFSKNFPDAAKRFGTPFLEAVQSVDDGIQTIAPIAMNTDFMAAVLGGDTRLGHKVVYIESEMGFYYKDCADGIYRQVSEDKLGNLMRAYMIRCAEEVPHNIHVMNLCCEFRSDKTIRSILHRARSILATDASFFGIDSKHVREQGPEIIERVARCFVEQVLERQAGEVLTLNDGYALFLEYLKRRDMAPVNRKVFKELVPPAVKDQFDLGIRNDLKDQAGGGWHSGWQGIRAQGVEPVTQN